MIICSAATCEKFWVKHFCYKYHATSSSENPILTFLIPHLVERPSFLSGGYDLLWGQDEPVEAGVSQLNAGNSNHQPFIGFENTLTELVSFVLLILARNKDIEGQEYMS